AALGRGLGLSQRQSGDAAVDYRRLALSRRPLQSWPINLAVVWSVSRPHIGVRQRAYSPAAAHRNTRSRHMNATFSTVLRWYLGILMSGLLLHGLVSLVFRLAPSVDAAMPYLVRGIFGIDFWHAWIHIAWGSLGMVIVARSRARQAQVWLALGFGA